MKEQGVDVVFSTWRGLMSQKQATDAERKEGAAIEKMAATPTWKVSLVRYGWLDAYQSAEGFGASLKEQQFMMKTALGDLGLLK